MRASPNEPRIVLITKAEVGGQLQDVVWSDGQIISVVPCAATSSAAQGGVEPETVVDAGGGALIPALHDHHIHLMALASSRQSIELGPSSTPTEADFVRALASAVAGKDQGEWVRGVGYHESVAGQLSAGRLDELVPSAQSIPIRIQHRSGQMWILNHAALAAIDAQGLANQISPNPSSSDQSRRVQGRSQEGTVEVDNFGKPTGQIFGLDAELGQRFAAVGGAEPSCGGPAMTVTGQGLAEVAAELASYGVSGITDCTPSTDPGYVAVLAKASSGPEFPLRVTITGGAGLPPQASPELARGPVKILPAERDIADFEALLSQFTRARGTGRPIAVHCVTGAGLAMALAAWDVVGPEMGDRIEHGAVISDESLDQIRDRQLVVITQPNFIAERGDQYLANVEPADIDRLWRCATLLQAGLAVAGGSDAPFGHPDPWRAIAAATQRKTPSGAVLGPQEQLSGRQALDLFLGSPSRPEVPRQIKPGQITDLCLLSLPLADALAAPSSSNVVGVVGPIMNV